MLTKFVSISHTIRKSTFESRITFVSNFGIGGGLRSLNVQKIPHSAMAKKMIRNPHADPDHHQKLTTSRGSPLAHACQVWSTSVSAFDSYPVYRMTERMTERSHNLRLVAGCNNKNKQCGRRVRPTRYAPARL